MFYQINQIIALVTALLLIIFSVFLLSFKKDNKLNHRLLLLFLLINAAFLSGFLVISALRPLNHFVYFLFFLFHISGFLFGPVIFLYAKSVTNAIGKVEKKETVHFIPFLLILLFVFLRFIVFMDERKTDYQSERFYVNLILNIQVMLYMICSIFQLRKHRKNIRNYYSSVEKLNYYWLSIVLYGFFFMWILDFINFISGRFFILPPEFRSSVAALSVLTNFIFAVLIFYEGLRHPQFFHPFPDSADKPKYEKSRLSNEESEKILNRLLPFMEKEKPYLNPAVTLGELSEKLDIPQRDLSQVINNSLKKNFYDFINSYRINESLIYLDSNSSKTILEILYEAGFNSKSTFYKVFKDFTGESPTSYRNRKISA